MSRVSGSPALSIETAHLTICSEITSKDALVNLLRRPQTWWRILETSTGIDQAFHAVGRELAVTVGERDGDDMGSSKEYPNKSLIVLCKQLFKTYPK